MSELSSEKLTAWHNAEIHEGFLFHAGHLWVGHTVPENYVEIISPTSAKPVKVPLDHGASSIYPYGKDSVLALGAFNSAKGHLHFAYSIIRPDGSKQPSIQTKEIPSEFFATEFAGSPGNMFFTEKGSNQLIRFVPWMGKDGEVAPVYEPKNEEEEMDLQKVLDVEAPGSKLINVSAKGNFAEETNQTGNVDPQALSGPDKMAFKDGKVFLIESRSTNPKDDGVAWVDPKEGKVHRPIRANRQGLSDLIATDGRFPGIIVAESLRSQLLMFSSKTGNLDLVVPVSSNPMAVQQLGRCLVVLGHDKTLQFLELNGSGTSTTAHVIDSWSVADYGFFLDYTRSLALDPVSKTAFVGSRRGCTYCQAQSNGVVKVSQPSGETFNYCLGK